MPDQPPANPPATPEDPAPQGPVPAGAGPAPAADETHAAWQRRIRGVFDRSPVPVWLAEGGVVVFANRAACRVMGAPSVASLIGQPLGALVDDASRPELLNNVARALAGELDVAVLQAGLVCTDGSVREVEVAVTALPDHGTPEVQLTVTDVSARVRETSRLERSRRDLRELSARVVEAREEERRRIARELHDELGQRLTALKMDISALRDVKDAAALAGRVDDMVAMVDETVASLRRISSDLRPLMLDDLGLNSAIEWLGRNAAKHMDIEVTVRHGGRDPAVDQRVATALYRMVQEALTNVTKHAKATDVRIDLVEDQGELVLTVEDNGVGLGTQGTDREGSFGVLGMRERAHMLGGSLDIANVPGSGARLTVRVPLNTAAGVEP